MKKRKVLPAIFILAFVLLALPSCTKDSGIDPNATADFTANKKIGFEVIWPADTSLPTGIDYKINITLSETAGVAATILNVTAKFTDSDLKSAS